MKIRRLSFWSVSKAWASIIEAVDSSHTKKEVGRDTIEDEDNQKNPRIKDSWSIAKVSHTIYRSSLPVLREKKFKIRAGFSTTLKATTSQERKKSKREWVIKIGSRLKINLNRCKLASSSLVIKRRGTLALEMPVSYKNGGNEVLKVFFVRTCHHLARHQDCGKFCEKASIAPTYIFKDQTSPIYRDKWTGHIALAFLVVDITKLIKVQWRTSDI